MTPENRSYKMLALFLLIVGVVAAIGGYFQPGAWYAGLAKPPWTPPNWVFGPAWTILYIMIAVTGWLIFSMPGLKAAKFLWIVQLILNGFWSFFFFGLQNIGLALADIFALIVCVLILMKTTYPALPSATKLLTPYLLWILYASSLNAGILWLYLKR